MPHMIYMLQATFDLISDLAWPALVAWILHEYKNPIIHLIKYSKFWFKGFGVSGKYDGTASLQETKPEKAREKTPILSEQELYNRNRLEEITPPLTLKYEQMLRSRVIEVSNNLHLSEDKLVYRFGAEVYLNLEFEKIYNNIWLSQTSLLKRLNELGGKADKDILAFYYNQAKEIWPEMYKEYTLEQWTNFLISHTLIEIENAKVSLTIEGSGFCVWLASNQYKDPAIG